MVNPFESLSHHLIKSLIIYDFLKDQCHGWACVLVRTRLGEVFQDQQVSAFRRSCVRLEGEPARVVKH